MTSKVEFSFGNLDALISSSEAMTEVITSQIHERVQQLSPVDTGDYQRGWEYEVDQDQGLVFNTDEPIEKLRALENGWSDSAPTGVLEPAVAEFRFLMNDYVRRQQ